MKRIVATVTNDLTYDQRMIRSCRALVEAGYSVTLIGRELTHSVELVDQPFQQIRLKCDRNSGPGFYAEYNIRLRSVLNELDYDVAIACDLDTIMAAGIAGRQRGKPFIYDAHEYFSEVPEVVDRPLVRSIWRLIGRRYVPRAAACYTVAPQLALKLQEEYGVPFGVVRNVPIISGAEVVPFGEREQTILYQGALNEGRGIETAIAAMHHLAGLRLQLAGEGDLSDQLREQVTSSGLSDRVEFLGRVEPDKLVALTRKALIGLNLLENRGLSYYYSLANKFFDYIQVGTPSINMRFPEYSSIMDDHRVGLLLDELDEDELVGKITSLLSIEEWQKCSDACMSARRQFNWDREKRELVRIVGEVLS